MLLPCCCEVFWVESCSLTRQAQNLIAVFIMRIVNAWLQMNYWGNFCIASFLETCWFSVSRRDAWCNQPLNKVCCYMNKLSAAPSFITDNSWPCTSDTWVICNTSPYVTGSWLCTSATWLSSWFAALSLDWASLQRIIMASADVHLALYKE
jgi:hypothetical protein